MATILEEIQNQKNFGAFVNENMKNSTYKIGWNAEMDVEYEASKSFKDITANYAAAMLGTVIDKNAKRPKRDMPNIGEVTGTLARIGDEWQIDNDRLERYYFMEKRFRDRMTNLTKEQQQSEYGKIVKYLFNPYELAAIAPHRRITAQYWEGLSDGQVTLTKTNNTGGVIWSAALTNGIVKRKLRSSDVVWSTGTLSTMDVLSVLQYAEELADLDGKSIVKFRVSKATAALICQCTQLKNLIGLSIGTLKTATTPMLSMDLVNTYLTGLKRAPIEVIDERGVLNTGTSVNLFKDGRLVAQYAPKVAVLKVSDPLELVDPIPNKVYTSYFDNLISQWRNDNGRYIGYEMFAFPAFTGRSDVSIIDVTVKD